MAFFHELYDESLSGVAYKNIQLKKDIIAFFSRHGNCTIADLCAELSLSTPKINDVLAALITEGLVKDYGKLQSRGGRKPNIYGLIPNYGYFLGVDAKNSQINIGVSDLDKNLIHLELDIPFTLSNDRESLNRLCEIIQDFIGRLPFKKEKLLAVGLSLPGRINYTTGQSYNSFHFDGEPAKDSIEKSLGLRVFLENDSRAMALGEFAAGAVKTEKDILFLNMGNGMGVGIIINEQLYYGKSGFAGEFGHIPFFDNEIICKCGKKGCLETEVSGWALVRNFKEKLLQGCSSILSDLPIEEIKLGNIIKAAINDDVLAIELIAEMGEKLGKGIAVLINIFNPEMVILGGRIAETGEYLRLPIKSALNKYSLSLVNNDTSLELSALGEKSGVIGACLLARNHLLA